MAIIKYKKKDGSTVTSCIGDSERSFQNELNELLAQDIGEVYNQTTHQNFRKVTDTKGRTFYQEYKPVEIKNETRTYNAPNNSHNPRRPDNRGSHRNPTR